MLWLNSCGENTPGIKVVDYTKANLEENMHTPNNQPMTIDKNVAIPEQVPDYY